MPDILYYDGQCPLCAKEMSHLRVLKDESLVLADIHHLPDNHSERPDKETLLRVLHLERGGEFLTGLDANVAAWQHTRYGIFWRWLRWPVVRWVADPVYRWWANRRYRRLYECAPCGQNRTQ